MKEWIKRFLFYKWPRKCLSLIAAVLVWIVVNQSLTTTKTIDNLSVRVVHLPPGKTIESMQPNGLLQKKLSLTITGNKQLIDELNSNTLEVVVDARDKRGEWIADITKQNLHALNPTLDLHRGVHEVAKANFIIKLTKLITEKVPIIITKPIGEPPKGYQFIDIWPYQLYITVSGPEDLVKDLKTRNLKLTFNLSDISKAQLDDIRQYSSSDTKDVVSFLVPNAWKQLPLPTLSETPIPINDPDVKYLRIDFLRYETLLLPSPVPVNIYFPPQFNASFHPQKTHIANTSLVETRNGVKMITKPLYVKGVSELFLNVIQDMMAITIVVPPSPEETSLKWQLSFMQTQTLEDRYVHTLLSDASDEKIYELQPQIREKYLRNRFRQYINHCQLVHFDKKAFDLVIQREGNAILLTEKETENSQ